MVQITNSTDKITLGGRNKGGGATIWNPAIFSRKILLDILEMLLSRVVRNANSDFHDLQNFPYKPQYLQVPSLTSDISQSLRVH